MNDATDDRSADNVTDEATEPSPTTEPTDPSADNVTDEATEPSPTTEPTDPSADNVTDEATEPSPTTEPTDPPALDLDRVAHDLAGVETALARLDDGSYWTDEVTGDPIPDEVHAADPIARRAP
jgi:RNA polymerase-binding transcription factor DksA